MVIPRDLGKVGWKVGAATRLGMLVLDPRGVGVVGSGMAYLRLPGVGRREGEAVTVTDEMDLARLLVDEENDEDDVEANPARESMAD